MTLNSKKIEGIRKLHEEGNLSEIVDILIKELPISGLAIMVHYDAIQSMKSEYDSLLEGEYDEAEANRQNDVIHQEALILRGAIFDLIGQFDS